MDYNYFFLFAAIAFIGFLIVEASKHHWMVCMDLHDISIIISLIAIFISLIPFLIDLYEDYGLPDWRIFETADKREERERQEKEKSILEELIKKYNVPTDIQKNLGAVTDKYFLIERFFDSFEDCHYYWIYSRQPDGGLGEKKGRITLCSLRFHPLTSYESDELNKMCGEEVQAESLKRRRRVLNDRFTSLW